MAKPKNTTIKKGAHFNVFIVGLGGTGSFLVSSLLQMVGNSEVLSKNTTITLIDGDTVEPKNLRNQKYLPEDVGSHKAEVLYQRYQDIYPDVALSYVPRYIESKEDLKKIFKSNSFTYAGQEITLLVGCVDNIKARRIMESLHDQRDFCRDLIYIDTGNGSGEELTGQTVISRSVLTTAKTPKSNSYTAEYVLEELLPRPSFYFPHILTEEEEVKTTSCGDIDPSTIQNIGANIMSASTVFGILNDIMNFNEIPGSLFVFDAKALSLKKSI